jgi:hypothetical protein
VKEAARPISRLYSGVGSFVVRDKNCPLVLYNSGTEYRACLVKEVPGI